MSHHVFLLEKYPHPPTWTGPLTGTERLNVHVYVMSCLYACARVCIAKVIEFVHKRVVVSVGASALYVGL